MDYVNSSLAMRMARSEIILNNVAIPMPLSLATCPARAVLDKLRLAFWDWDVGSACLSVCLSPTDPKAL